MSYVTSDVTDSSCVVKVPPMCSKSSPYAPYGLYGVPLGKAPEHQLFGRCNATA